MNIYTLISIMIGIFAVGVVVTIISLAIALRVIINRCHLVLGPGMQEITKIARQLKVYSSPDRLTLRRNGKKPANMVSIK